MKFLKNRFLSLLVASTIFFSTVNVYSGCLSFLWGKKVPKKRSSLGFIKKISHIAIFVGVIASVYFICKNLFIGNNSKNDSKKDDDPSNGPGDSSKRNNSKNTDNNKNNDKGKQESDINKNKTLEETKDKTKKDLPTFDHVQDKNDHKKEKKIVQARSGYQKRDGELDLSRHIKYFNRVGNIEYIQLKTVNQGSSKVISKVQEKYNSTVKEIYDKKTKKKITVGDFNYAPNGTCGCQSLRNGYWIYNFLSNNNHERKEYCLRVIKDKGNANRYLDRVIRSGSPTSWLENVDLERRIRRYSYDIASHITLIDTVLGVEVGFYNNITQNFRRFGSYFHVFIVNTGDVFSGAMNNVFEIEKAIMEQEYKHKMKPQWFNNFKKSGTRGNHWYVLALEQKVDHQGNIIRRCFIMDTLGGNHVTMQNPELFLRNRHFCEYIFNGYSGVNFRRVIEENAKYEFRNNILTNKNLEEIFEGMKVQKKKLKINENKKTQKKHPKKPVRKINPVKNWKKGKKNSQQTRMGKKSVSVKEGVFTIPDRNRT